MCLSSAFSAAAAEVRILGRRGRAVAGELVVVGPWNVCSTVFIVSIELLRGCLRVFYSHSEGISSEMRKGNNIQV